MKGSFSSCMEMNAAWFDLAPLELKNFRVRRYHGDDLCLPVSAFSVDDQARLRILYIHLQQLLDALTPDHDRPSISRVEKFIKEQPLDDIIDLAQQFGRSSHSATPSSIMAKTIHDLRGGGLTPLLGHLQFAQLRGITEATSNALYFLTRDHLKIMRNALLGLDDAKREEDLRINVHTTDFIVQKWHGAILHGHGRHVRLDVECQQPSSISECCVEFGAIDRILYNLINNACRHTVADFIRLIIFPVPGAQGRDLRIILVNTVSAADLKHLSSFQIETIFEEGISTTGSGCGLAIAAEFVSNAYGLQNTAQAIENGYLGATIIDESFTAWFHWPRISED